MSILKKTLLLFSAILLTIGVMAQSVEEAGAKYNEGNNYYKEKDYSNAITSYKEALSITNEVGTDASDLKGNIEKQLLNATYSFGKGQYKARKFDAAIAIFEKSFALAEQLGDDSKKKNSKSYIAKVRTSKGSTLLKENKIETAIAEYIMATEISPKYYKAYYGMVQAYKAQGNMTEMMLNADKVLELTEGNTKAEKTIKKTKSTASKALVNAGAKEIQKEHGKKAIEYINSSFIYAPGNEKAYYYLSLAYGKEKNWDDAITSAKKAISVEPEKDKSEIYFSLGQAYEGNNNAENACKAYKSVTSGPNVESAKYQITQVLKCN